MMSKVSSNIIHVFAIMGRIQQKKREITISIAISYCSIRPHHHLALVETPEAHR